MEQYRIHLEEADGIATFKVSGYFEKAAGKSIIAEAEKLFEAGIVFLVLDLSECEVLSSPGVSMLVELAIDSADNYDGKLILCGLDKLKEKVLTLVGIHTMAEVVATLPEALALAKSLK